LRERKKAPINVLDFTNPTPQTKELVLTLSADDYEKATTVANYHNETLAEWISGLVNTALQP
jgi:hypothetical protein